MSEVLISTPMGFGNLDRIYVSELGYLMIRIDNLDGSFTTYNFGKHNPDDNIFTNQLIENEKSKNY